MQHKKSVEELYILLNPSARTTCVNCGKESKLLSISRGYRECCSNSCSSKHFNNNVDKVKLKVERSKKIQTCQIWT